MAEGSTNPEEEKKLTVMSLDYIKNSLLRKSNKTAECLCNKEVGLDGQESHKCISLKQKCRNGECKDSEKKCGKHKNGFLKTLSKRFWGKTSASVDGVALQPPLNPAKQIVLSDYTNCSYSPSINEYNTSKDSSNNSDENHAEVNEDLSSEVVVETTNVPVDLQCIKEDRNCSGSLEENNASSLVEILDEIDKSCEDKYEKINEICSYIGVNDGNVLVPMPSPKTRSLTRELLKLAKYGWYWGPITREEAEEKLQDQPDGAFLVRDSSADHYLLSLSFRSSGKLLHTRIEHSQGLFSFYHQPEKEGFASIGELIEHSVSFSQSAVVCYSRPRSPGHPSFPVRLTKPVSRFTQVRSLQYLCRFVIRQYIRVDNIQNLPLPNRLKGYIQEGQY